MKLTCPECKYPVDVDEWEIAEASCEDCGSHPAIGCPCCGHVIDCIFNEEADAILDEKLRKTRNLHDNGI